MNNNRILITQRPFHVHHGGFWEFPGGKLEPDELAAEALIREVEKKLELRYSVISILGTIYHSYPNKSVELIVFHVTEFSWSS